MLEERPNDSGCRLCGGTALIKVSEIAPESISKVYASTLDIDLLAVGCDLPAEAISMLRCSDCGLRQFRPDWIGSPGLYEALQEFPWYYQESKYEFEAAKAFVKPGDSVLEVGCATGNFRKHLPSDLSYTGLEFNQRAINAAQMRGLNVSATPLEKMATERTGAFDCVFAFQVLEHVPQPRTFLLNMVAATKPGGLIIFSVPNEESFLHHEVNNVTNLPPHHATRWSGATFERLGALIGAQLVDISHEPLTPDHRRAYAVAQIWRVISSLLPVGRNGVSPISSGKLFRRAILLMSLPVRLWISMSPAVLRGHTVVVTLRKL